MNYTILPSLEHFALVKTAITLWNPEDLFKLSTRFYFTQEEWEVAENHVIGKVKELPFPESLKMKVLGFIKPIGIEICKWLNCHLFTLSDGITVKFRNLVREIFKKLCWTPQGIIDEKKTAERLVREENLNITTRYKLACINCLKSDILMLWNKMPEYCRNMFYNKDPRRVMWNPLVVLWTYEIKGELTRMRRIAEEKWPGCTPYQYAFDCAVHSGNKAATEYFLQKLTSEEREESLEMCRYVDPHKYTLCYLLSQMNVEQQHLMFRNYPYEVLSCLLDWPLQGLFMEIPKHMFVCSFLHSMHYYSFLKAIVRKVKDGFKDYNYQKLFREFWQESPLSHKEFVIDKCAGKQSLLQDLLQIKDKENIKLILEDATILDREIIFSGQGKDICETLIYNDGMDLLEFFVQGCISSKDLMIQFRKEFEEYIISSRSMATRKREKGMWSKVFQLLNDLIQKYDKTSCVEEGNNDPVKELCSLTIE